LVCRPDGLLKRSIWL